MRDGGETPEQILRRRVSQHGESGKVAFFKGAWHIDTTVNRWSDKCPQCGKALAFHGWRSTNYLDEPIDSHPVRIKIRRPRLICRWCQRTLTPTVPDVLEPRRLTQRLVDYIRLNLWSMTSLRELARGVGCAPKTIANVLSMIADEARKAIAYPSNLGIHELKLNQARHLLLSDLDTTLIVDFLPAGKAQLQELRQRLFASEVKQPIRSAAVPVDPLLTCEVRSLIPTATIFTSPSCVHRLLADAVADATCLESQKRRRASTSCAEARRLAALRTDALNNGDRVHLSAGVQKQNAFGELYVAKENLMEDLERRVGDQWGALARSWFGRLPVHRQLNFAHVVTMISELASLEVGLVPSPAVATIEQNVDALRGLLLKPGRGFTAEMISALVLASPFMEVPLDRRVGRKGSGTAWLEEPSEEDLPLEPTIAGISLGTLVSLLAELHSIREMVEPGPTAAPATG